MRPLFHRLEDNNIKPHLAEKLRRRLVSATKKIVPLTERDNRLRIDSYDMSCEFYDVSPEYSLTPAQCERLWALGYATCWLNWRGGETVYSQHRGNEAKVNVYDNASKFKLNQAEINSPQES